MHRDFHINQPSTAAGFTHRRDKSARVEKDVYAVPPPLNFRSSSFTIGNTAQTLLGANKLRRYICIQNTGSMPVFVGFGITPTISGANSLVINPGFAYTTESNAPINDISFITPSFTTTISIVEGIINEHA